MEKPKGFWRSWLGMFGKWWFWLVVIIFAIVSHTQDPQIITGIRIILLIISSFIIVLPLATIYFLLIWLSPQSRKKRKEFREGN